MLTDTLQELSPFGTRRPIRTCRSYSTGGISSSTAAVDKSRTGPIKMGLEPRIFRSATLQSCEIPMWSGRTAADVVLMDLKPSSPSTPPPPSASSPRPRSPFDQTINKYRTNARPAPHNECTTVEPRHRWARPRGIRDINVNVNLSVFDRFERQRLGLRLCVGKLSDGRYRDRTDNDAELCKLERSHSRTLGGLRRGRNRLLPKTLQLLS